MNAKSCLSGLALALASSMCWAQYDPTIATDSGSGLTGLGSAAQGIGAYNYYTAGAIRELEDARALAIDNHRQAVQNWYALKRLNRQERAHKLDPLTAEQLAAVIEWQRPDRLASFQYNPATASAWAAPSAESATTGMSASCGSCRWATLNSHPFMTGMRRSSTIASGAGGSCSRSRACIAGAVANAGNGSRGSARLE